MSTRLRLHAMDIPLKELDKLQKLTSLTSKPSLPNSSLTVFTPNSLAAAKGKQTTGVADALDGLLAALRDVKERVESGTASEQDVANISKIVEERKKEVDERQKEIHATLGRIGKALDKVCCSCSLYETNELELQLMILQSIPQRNLPIPYRICLLYSRLLKLRKHYNEQLLCISCGQASLTLLRFS